MARSTVFYCDWCWASKQPKRVKATHIVTEIDTDTGDSRHEACAMHSLVAVKNAMKNKIKTIRLDLISTNDGMVTSNGSHTASEDG